MRLAWLTDVHLNYVEAPARQEFYSSVRTSGADAVLLGGDIGEAPNVVPFLQEVSSGIQLPIYFVLGNHDFYGGSIPSVRQQVSALSPNLVWLPAAGVVKLNARTALIGHDGWADGRLGDFVRSPVAVNDYAQIAELAACGMQKDCLYRMLNALGDQAAGFVEAALASACAGSERVVLLTHPPPFAEACWYEGKLSNGDWLPHFTCKAMGDAILRVMARYPDRRLLVFCGHTHSTGVAQVAANVVVRTGGAVYGSPAIQKLLEV